MLVILVKILKQLITLILDHRNRQQIAYGVAFSAFFGLLPFNFLLFVLLLFILCLFKFNLSSIFFGALIFKLLRVALDPVSDFLGYFLLVTCTPLVHFWTFLYNSPVFPWLNFNHTLQLGSFVLATLLFFPTYYGFLQFLDYFRQTLKPRLENSKLLTVLKASPVFHWAFKVKDWIA
ncbi:MAG: TIGR03546 family protein [bacterium]